MSGTITSAFRHVFAEASKTEDSYQEINVSTSPVDSNMLAANARFVAIPWDVRGGGSFAVLKAEGKGKLGANAPLFTGHKSPVIDVAFDPFNDYLVASAAEDATIKIWNIVDAGDKILPQDAVASLTGHARKVCRLAWNPLIDGCLASFGAENAVKLWDVRRGSCALTIKGPTQQWLDIAWSQDGNRLALPCKDKKLHVFDARAGTEIFTAPGHYGVKGSRAVFHNNTNLICTTGYSQNAARQIAVRDERNPDKLLASEDVDYNAGILVPFIDADTGVVFTFGRGDCVCKYYELRSDEKPLFALSQYTSQEAFRAVALAPKYAVDTSKCEIDRFYMVTASKILHRLPMIVPRRNADSFQSDIYPDTIAPEPSLDFATWKEGENAVPKKISLENEVRLSDARTFSVEEITTSDEATSLRAGLTEAQKTIDALKARIAELEQQIEEAKAAKQ